MIDLAFQGRYVKVIDDRCIQHFGVKNGDYLKYSHTNESRHEHWGDVAGKQYYYGSNAHKMRYFTLCPEGYVPPKGSVIKEDNQALSKFPSEGVCWKPTKELRDYLGKRFNQYSSNTTSKGVAWSAYSYWTVEESSGKPVFDITQLEPFIATKYYDQYQDEIKVGDHFIVDAIDNDAHGVKGIVGKFYQDFGKAMVELQRPLPRHPGGGELLAIPLSKLKVISVNEINETPMTPEECRLPNKWCMKTTAENVQAISDFLIKRKNEFNGYNESWKDLLPLGFYFHYPQFSSGTRAASVVKSGYTEIFFEQFKAYVLQSEKVLETLPDKWCINVDTKEISIVVKKYAMDKGLNRKRYSFGSTGFPYYHFDKSGCVDHHDFVVQGYTLITFDQFKKYVLLHTEAEITHTDKTKEDYLTFKKDENGRSIEPNTGITIKVQGPNLTIRGGDAIRATGIRCSKVEIEIRSGHIPD